MFFDEVDCLCDATLIAFLRQVCGYMDRLGVDEGWLVVFDPDMAKPWDEKISHEDRVVDGKTIHVFLC